MAIRTFGPTDTWENNAGVRIYGDLLATPRDEHERLFRTNYWGTVNGAQATIPHLRQSGGALITVGSIASDIGSPVLGAYTASTHAAKGYIDSLRIELNRAKAGVSVSLIKPAGIGTPPVTIGQSASNSGVFAYDVIAAFHQGLPCER